MILEIDAGNTFVKWRLRDQDEVLRHGKFLTGQTDWVVPVEWEGAEQAYVASVAGEQTNQRIKALVKCAGIAAPRFAKTVARQSGVVNSYAEPARMGVDRWLVMLAAYNDCGNACCIVDCGSAITVDFVSATGLHEGGYILPGLRLMNASLRNDTAEIIVDQSIEKFSILPGTHTSAAVIHGVNYLFKALCQQLCADLEQQRPEYTLYITGGDGELFAELAGRGRCVPDLVLDGLRWVGV